MLRHRHLSRLFWGVAAAAAVLALIPAEHRYPEPVIDWHHVEAFAVLGALAALCWPGARLRLVVGLLTFGAAIEAVQLIPALNRGASLVDLMSDAVGIGLGLALAGVAGRWVPAGPAEAARSA